MIKEYIEDLPGGEKFIQAQRGFGLIFGAIIGIIIGLSGGVNAIGFIIKGRNPEDVLTEYLIINGIGILIVIIVGIIGYYYHLSSADKSYTRNLLNNTKNK